MVGEGYVFSCLKWCTAQQTKLQRFIKNIDNKIGYGYPAIVHFCRTTSIWWRLVGYNQEPTLSGSQTFINIYLNPYEIHNFIRNPNLFQLIQYFIFHSWQPYYMCLYHSNFRAVTVRFRFRQWKWRHIPMTCTFDEFVHFHP